MKMRIDKVLLLTPPALTSRALRDMNPMPPLGLGYLASVVEDLGIDVKIVDCLVLGWDQEEEVGADIIRVGLSDKEIVAIIEQFDPDVVGISCMFSRQHRIYHHILRIVKSTKPDCITIAGGAHVTVCPDDVLNNPACDFVIMGEAENSFREFLLAIIRGNELDQVDGLGWKENDALLINRKGKWLTDLDSISFPAYHLMELDRYFGLEASHGRRHRTRFCPIMTSRGCPARCTFCSAKEVWGKKYRFRSVDNVLEEMSLLKETYGIEELMFEDDNVTANPKRALELFSGMLKEGFDFVWDTPNGVGVWSINEEMLDEMKQSGCAKLNFPVESGSQSVLDHIIKKPLKLSKVKNLIRYCDKIDLDYGMFLVIGMPGETIGDMWKSFRFAADCGCYNPHISVATPYPGSELFDKCVERNYFVRDFTFDDLFIKSFMIKTADWTERDLKKVLFKALLYLNLRGLLADPRYQLKRVMRNLYYPDRVTAYMKRLISYLRG